MSGRGQTQQPTNMATQIDQYRELYAILETTQRENFLPGDPIWLRIEELVQQIRYTDPLDRVLLPPRLPPARSTSEDDAEIVPDVEDHEEVEDGVTWRRRVRQRREAEWNQPGVIDLELLTDTE
jgi:hypothetical protein